MVFTSYSSNVPALVVERNDPVLADPGAIEMVAGVAQSFVQPATINYCHHSWPSLCREGGRNHFGWVDAAALLACWPEADWVSGSAASMLGLSRVRTLLTQLCFWKFREGRSVPVDRLLDSA